MSGSACPRRTVRISDEKGGDIGLVNRFNQTNRIERSKSHPSDLILRRPPTEVGLARLRQREVSKSATADFDGRPSRRMAAGTISPVAVLRDARKSALLSTAADGGARYDPYHGNAVLATETIHPHRPR